MPDTIRILIADDHLIIREGLRLILETNARFSIVGEAEDGAQAVQLAVDLDPQVILMDLRMPVMDGLTAIQQIHTARPHIAIVILTTYNEDDLMVHGLQARARGYLLKDTSREVLFNTIEAAARGETLLKPEILARLLNRTTPAPSFSSHSGGPDLTERELEVLKAVARGDRSKEIAVRLNITERTVKAHLASIYNKLGVDSRAAAIATANQRGLNLLDP